MKQRIYTIMFVVYVTALVIVLALVTWNYASGAEHGSGGGYECIQYADSTPTEIKPTTTPKIEPTITPEIESTPIIKPTKQACNQGIGNGAESCDPGNSNNNQPSNDEDDRKPGTRGPRGNN